MSTTMMDIIHHMDMLGQITPTPHYSVIIIGGGFTGSVLAAHLAQHSTHDFSVLILDRNPSRGRGVAYGTQCDGHLLNVPAGNMSAFHDDPEHFWRWAQAHYDPLATSGRFLPRRVYGQYVDWVLAYAAGRHPGKIKWQTDEVESVTRSDQGTRVRLRGGNMLTADRVVLAQGNFPPAASNLPEAIRKNGSYVANPWAADSLDGIQNHGNILLVGSGLTSVDMTIALRARGFKGVIHVLSRRGLLPQKHMPGTPWPPFWDEAAPRTARGLLRLVREQVEAAQRRGCGWRAVIDSLRPFTAAIWQTLPMKEKQRFLRHVRPYWEVHRHRVAPEIGRALEQQIASGEIEIHAGRIVDCRDLGNRVEVTFRDRKTRNSMTLIVDRMVNCTGPETDCRKLNDPLTRDLLRQGLVRPDPLFLGLDVAADGAVIDARGTPSDSIYALGPARKGRLWETTAVPEIRQQIAELASLLALKSRSRFQAIESEAVETTFAAD